MQMNILEAISARGLIVTRGISFYRANKKLTKEDLGLDEVPEGMKLGHLKLIEENEILDQMKQIESDVGGEINKRTYDFCGLARFLPREKLDELSTFIESKRDEFLVLQEQFFAQYDEIKEQAVTNWVDKTPANVTEAHMRRAVANAFPSRGELRRKFKFHFAFMPLADLQGVNRAEELNNMCDTFIQEVAVKARAAAVKTIEQITETFEEGKYTNRTINTAKRLIERVREMALIPDAELESKIEAFNAEFGDIDAKDAKKDDNIEKRLMAGVKKLGADLREMAQADVLEEAKSKFIQGAGRSID